MNEAAMIWLAAIKDTGIWMAPFSDQVAYLGYVITPQIQQAIDAARAEERERCALIADEWDELGYYGAGGIAAAIRNQGDET
jgi:hypothetical protein